MADDQFCTVLDQLYSTLSERVLAATPGRTLYARVDVATGPEGTPLLQELFANDPEQAARPSDNRCD